jgi:hypothetical protein
MAKCIFTIYYANFTLCSVEYTLYSVVKLQKKCILFSASSFLYLELLYVILSTKSSVFSESILLFSSIRIFIFGSSNIIYAVPISIR